MWHIKNNLRLEVLSSYIVFSVFLPFSLVFLKVLSPEDHLMFLVTLISGHRHWSLVVVELTKAEGKFCLPGVWVWF